MRSDKGALVFSSREAGLEAAVEGLRGLYAAGAHVEPRAQEVHARVRARRTPSGVVSDRRLDGVALVRDVRLVRRTGFNHFVLQRVFAGQLQVAFDDVRLTLGEGDTLLLDTTRPYEMAFAACRLQTVSVSREQLAEAGLDVARLHGASGHRAWEAAPAGGGEEVGGDLDALHQDLRSLAPGAARASAGAAGRRERALAYIEAHLNEGGLSPERVRAGTLTSRSALYRVFEELGGVSDWVQTRRLRRLRTALETDGRSLKELAHDLGFASVSHASHAFAARYGVRPGALRAARRAELADGPADGVRLLLADMPAALARESDHPVRAAA